MNDEEFMLLREESLVRGALLHLDERYDISINSMMVDPTNNTLSICLSLFNHETQDFIILEGMMTLEEKHYVFVVVNTNNEIYVDPMFIEKNVIIKHMSPGLVEKFENKMDVVHSLMSQPEYI